MAGAGAKKRLEENKQRVSTLRIWVAVGLLSYFARLVLLFLRRSSTFWHWAGFALTSATNYFTYTSIAGFAAPTYGPQGELIDGGADLSMKGMCSYYHDLLYITTIVQVGASFSGWFWYVYLLVPAYAAYVFCQSVLFPWLKASKQREPGPLDPAAKKKLERAEKRAMQRAQKWR